MLKMRKQLQIHSIKTCKISLTSLRLVLSSDPVTFWPSSISITCLSLLLHLPSSLELVWSLPSKTLVFQIGSPSGTVFLKSLITSTTLSEMLWSSSTWRWSQEASFFLSPLLLCPFCPQFWLTWMDNLTKRTLALSTPMFRKNTEPFTLVLLITRKERISSWSSATLWWARICCPFIALNLHTWVSTEIGSP